MLQEEIRTTEAVVMGRRVYNMAQGDFVKGDDLDLMSC